MSLLCPLALNIEKPKVAIMEMRNVDAVKRRVELCSPYFVTQVFVGSLRSK